MTAEFVFKSVIAGVVPNEGDYHSVVVVKDRESLDIWALVGASNAAR